MLRFRTNAHVYIEAELVTSMAADQFQPDEDIHINVTDEHAVFIFISKVLRATIMQMRSIEIDWD